MLEDVFFTHLAKNAINQFPVISGNCSRCPIRYIEDSMSNHRDFFKESYLRETTERSGSSCFLIAQKMQLLKIAKIQGFVFDKKNNGYVGCSNFYYDQENPRVKLIKIFDKYNKI